ncbi:helix-turn-helix domain-containing protein [Cohnella sp. GCM10012308]|uniref:helix-turn-helix domain-containing protein n=1 Tax=Cohnella sp. GCM10012308 TaxID=3317329 RepID=UPI0036152E55
MYEVFEELLKKNNVTAYRVAKETGITTATFTSWKQGKYTPKREKLQKIADYFGVSIDFLTGKIAEEPSENEQQPASDLSDKEERDIAKKLEAMMNELESDTALSFHGEPMDDEERELMKISLENTLRLSRQMAKKKYTPKKYQ